MQRKIIIDTQTVTATSADDCTSKDFSSAITALLSENSLDISQQVKPLTYRLLILWEDSLLGQGSYTPKTFEDFTTILTDIQDIIPRRLEETLDPTEQHEWHQTKTILEKHQGRLTAILGQLFEDYLKQSIKPLAMETFIDNLNQGQYFLNKLSEKIRNPILNRYLATALEKMDTQEQIFATSGRLDQYYHYIQSIEQHPLIDLGLKITLKTKLAHHFKRYRVIDGTEDPNIIADIIQRSIQEEWGSTDKTYTLLAHLIDQQQSPPVNPGILHGIEGRQRIYRENLIARKDFESVSGNPL
jgi:hypothetical protein